MFSVYRGFFGPTIPNVLMLSAPNRYRKLVKGFQKDESIVSSPALQLLSLESCAGWTEAMQKCVEMQKQDWPDLAAFAIGIEPLFDLTDVVLVWDKRK